MRRASDFIIKSEELSVCPICGGRFCVIGTRERKIIETDGSVTILIIRRFCCCKCGKIHHELPDVLVPYKRHCAESIEKIIGGKGDEVSCESSTIRKIKTWWERMLPYLIGVLNSLNAKYGMAFTGTSAPKEIVRAVVNANLWVHTRSACMSG